MAKYNRNDCIELLCKKQEYLNTEGLSRYPQRSDFEADEVIAIKAFLGPWPRALEAAGLKPPRDDGKLERQIEKRIRSKRRKTEFKKQKRAGSLEEPTPTEE